MGVNASWIKKVRVPHVFILLAEVILFCSIFTYIIPSGTYEREEKQIGSLTRTVVIPGTYEELPKHVSARGILLGEEVEGKATPVSITGLLSAIPRGLEESADIIFFIFLIGGVFGIVQKTGTIVAVIQGLLKRFSGSGPLLTIVIMIVVSIGGSTIGMGEELIPLVPVFLLISKELGYDRIYGLALVLVGAETGFAAATTNPFTVQIAQGIAEVPIGSGIGFRIIFYLVIISITIGYVLYYGRTIKKDPSKSLMKGDKFDVGEYEIEDHSLKTKHWVIMILSAVIFGFILIAVQKLGWWLTEMSGGFLLIGILAAVIGGLTLSESTRAFVKGMEEMVVAALVVGFARGIQVVLQDAQVMDSMIFYVASILQQFPRMVGAEGMLIFQTLLNFFIPSGSGQAAATMPLMAPLADVVGLSRQTAVFAFTCGDGFSNTLIPTSGLLMAMLSLAKIPYTKWLKFMLPLFITLLLTSGIFLAIAVAIGY